MGWATLGTARSRGSCLTSHARLAAARSRRSRTACTPYTNAQYEAVYGGMPPERRPVLGFYIAGYSHGVAFPEEFEFVLPRDDAPFRARGLEEFGASWRGVDAPFTRLYKGFDPYVLPQRLAERGFQQADIEQFFDPEGLETQVIFEGMPVQDAINFATYILDTTIGWSTFALGVPVCARPLQVATILADKGFAWVAEPELRVQS